MRLLFITQQVDPAHPALAATVPKIAALARRVDEVVVLADGAVPGALPANCRVRTFRARGKLGRGLRFEAALARELAPRPHLVLAHMCPIYAVLAAPLCRPAAVPLLLWYTHWRATATLRLAERLASDVVSVDRRSFPLPSAKVVATGHGIDVSALTCQPPREPDRVCRLLALGRYSRAKGLETIVRALPLLPDARLTVHGPRLSDDERAHRGELGRLVEELGLSDRVTLGEAILRSELPELLGRFDALVNNMRAGAPDKVVYEAGAACLPVLASNPVLDELLDGLALPLRFERERPESLAERVRSLAVSDRATRAAVGRTLRERVERGHSVDTWADRILAVAAR